MVQVRAPVGFGAWFIEQCTGRPLVLRAAARVPFTPERVVIASAFFDPYTVSLVGDGQPYELEVRPLWGGGVHLRVQNPHEALEYELTLTPSHAGAAGLLGYVEAKKDLFDVEDGLEDDLATEEEL